MLDKARQLRGTRLPYLRNANVRWGAFSLSDLLEMPFTREEVDRFNLEPGDLVVCEGGEPGRAAVWREDGSRIKFQKALLRVRPGSTLLSDWLAFSLRRDALSGELEGHFTGSTIKHFTRQALLRYRLPLPPRQEQQRLVAGIGKAIAVVNGAQWRLLNAKAIIRRFRQAILGAACDGTLSATWRTRSGTPPASEMLNPPWPVVAAGSFFERADYGTSVRCERDVPGGIPVLRIPNIASGRLDTSDLKFAPRASLKTGEADVREGDILVCRTNGSLDLIGKAAVVSGLSKPHSFASYLIRLRLRENSTLPAFFHLFLSSPTGRDQIEQASRTTAGQYNLNLKILSELALPLPAIPEQREIVRRVEALFTVADAIEKRVAFAAARADKLTQAILAKAFRGELVLTEAELDRRRAATARSPERGPATSGPAPASRRRPR
jgi:type I restriction enzyme S subunit